MFNSYLIVVGKHLKQRQICLYCLSVTLLVAKHQTRLSLFFGAFTRMNVKPAVLKNFFLIGKCVFNAVKSKFSEVSRFRITNQTHPLILF